MANILMGSRLRTILVEHGIVPANTRRIVIDIPCDGMVTIYYDTIADEEQLLEANLPVYLKDGLCIQAVARPADAEGKTAPREKLLHGPIDITPTGAPMRVYSDEHGNHPGD